MNIPTHYFIHVYNPLNILNKHQTEFKNYLETLNGLIITINDRDNFKQEILIKQEQINNKYKDNKNYNRNCSKFKEINISFKWNENGVEYMTNFNSISLYIREAFLYY